MRVSRRSGQSSRTLRPVSPSGGGFAGGGSPPRYRTRPRGYAPSPGHDPHRPSQPPGTRPTDTTGSEPGQTPPRHRHPTAENRHAGRPTTTPPHRHRTTDHRPAQNPPRPNDNRPHPRPQARHRTPHQARAHNHDRPTARPRHTTTPEPPNPRTTTRPAARPARARPAPSRGRGDGTGSTPPGVAAVSGRDLLWPTQPACRSRPRRRHAGCPAAPWNPGRNSPAASNPAGCPARHRGPARSPGPGWVGRRHSVGGAKGNGGKETVLPASWAYRYSVPSRCARRGDDHGYHPGPNTRYACGYWLLIPPRAKDPLRFADWVHTNQGTSTTGLGSPPTWHTATAPLRVPRVWSHRTKGRPPRGLVLHQPGILQLRH